MSYEIYLACYHKFARKAADLLKATFFIVWSNGCIWSRYRRWKMEISMILASCISKNGGTKGLPWFNFWLACFLSELIRSPLQWGGLQQLAQTATTRYCESSSLGSMMNTVSVGSVIALCNWFKTPYPVPGWRFVTSGRLERTGIALTTEGSRKLPNRAPRIRQHSGGREGSYVRVPVVIQWSRVIVAAEEGWIW